MFKSLNEVLQRFGRPTDFDVGESATSRRLAARSTLVRPSRSRVPLPRGPRHRLPAGRRREDFVFRIAEEQQQRDQAEGAGDRAEQDDATAGGTIPVDKMSPEQLAALKKLQDYERRVAVKNFELEEEIFDPVEERIENEMFARKVQ